MTKDHFFKSLQNFVSKELELVNKLIYQMTESQEELVSMIAEYVISSGGKRLRPILTILSAKICGYQEGSRHINLAAAVEFIHTATLLHDDVVDESHLRRGEKTANDKWGNKASILVGDFLLSRAFQMMVNDGSIEVLRTLSDASAIISEGEVMQLSASKNIDITKETYFTIINAKTAELFSAACKVGAMVLETPNTEKQNAIESYGRNLGMAFQISDDTLDYAASSEIFGKNIGDDFIEGKVTIPLLLSFEKANDPEKQFIRNSLKAESRKEFLPEITEIIHKYHAIDLSHDIAENYLQNAHQSLSIFPDSKEKELLNHLLDFVIKRVY